MARFISQDDYVAIKSEALANEVRAKAMMDTVKSDFAATKKDLNGRILLQCEVVLRDKFSQYDRVRKDFDKFFDVPSLTRQLDLKADIDMIKEVAKRKVNHVEHNQTKIIISNLHDRVKHLAVVQAELADSLIPYKSQINSIMDSEDKLKTLKSFEDVSQ